SEERADLMKCPFCAGYHELPIKKEEVEEHLIVTTTKNFHFHVHGPIGQKSLMKQFLLKIAKEAGIEIEDEEDAREVKGKAGGKIIEIKATEVKANTVKATEVKANTVKANVGGRVDQDQAIEVKNQAIGIGQDQAIKANGEDQERSAEGH
ncbi:unnamed protein product, partial [marine sediment metagenome]